MAAAGKRAQQKWEDLHKNQSILSEVHSRISNKKEVFPENPSDNHAHSLLHLGYNDCLVYGYQDFCSQPHFPFRGANPSIKTAGSGNSFDPLADTIQHNRSCIFQGQFSCIGIVREAYLDQLLEFGGSERSF